MDLKKIKNTQWLKSLWIHTRTLKWSLLNRLNVKLISGSCLSFIFLILIFKVDLFNSSTSITGSQTSSHSINSTHWGFHSSPHVWELIQCSRLFISIMWSTFAPSWSFSHAEAAEQESNEAKQNIQLYRSATPLGAFGFRITNLPEKYWEPFEFVTVYLFHVKNIFFFKNTIIMKCWKFTMR